MLCSNCWWEYTQSAQLAYKLLFWHTLEGPLFQQQCVIPNVLLMCQSHCNGHKLTKLSCVLQHKGIHVSQKTTHDTCWSTCSAGQVGRHSQDRRVCVDVMTPYAAPGGYERQWFLLSIKTSMYWAHETALWGSNWSWKLPTGAAVAMALSQAKLNAQHRLCLSIVPNLLRARSCK